MPRHTVLWNRRTSQNELSRKLTLVNLTSNAVPYRWQHLPFVNQPRRRAYENPVYKLGNCWLRLEHLVNEHVTRRMMSASKRFPSSPSTFKDDGTRGFESVLNQRINMSLTIGFIGGYVYHGVNLVFFLDINQRFSHE